MPELLQKLFLFSLALMLGSAPAIADDERWYRVELLVFSQDPEHTAELFEPEPLLGYPDAFRFLLHPEQLKALQNQQLKPVNESTVELDAFGRIAITGSAPMGDNEEQAQPALLPSRMQPKFEQRIDEPDIDTAAEMPSEDEPSPRPTPFTVLPEDVRELNAAAGSLARRGRINVLFHQSWNQPISRKSQALPLVLDTSGDNKQWSTLQGSILLHRSRYLHLETNLWRNTDGRYLHNQWRMTPAPLGPPSIIIEQAPQAEIFTAPEEADITSFGAAPLPADEVAMLPSVEMEPKPALQPIYPYRHAVLMQQKRRMRSNEVHYIDHPMLGVLIKITPLTEEDLLIQAKLEQQLWPHIKEMLEQTEEP